MAISNDTGLLKPLALFAFILCFLIAMGTGVVSCTDESDTRRTLDAHGFSDIQTQGYGWFACSKNDTYATKFTAKNPKGQPVSGVVCCGIVKNCTVRF